MPISGGKYVAPTWHNNAAPALDETELQAMSDTIEANQDSYEVGDIYFTTRTDLGDDWLLCNGQTISPNLYPELYPMLPQKPVNWNMVKDLGTSIVGDLYYNGENYVYTAGGYCHVATSLTGTYTSKNVAASGNAAVPVAGDPNHYWFAAGDDDAEFYYADSDITSWTMRRPHSTSQNSGSRMTAYGNGIYVVYSNVNDWSYYCSSPRLNSWVKVPSEYQVLGFVNGYWYAREDNIIGNHVLYYTTDLDTPAGSWNKVNLPRQHQNYDIYYFDGKYFIYGTGNQAKTVYYASSLNSSSWNELETPYTGSDTAADFTMYFVDSVYFFKIGDEFYATRRLTNPDWQTIDASYIGGSGNFGGDNPIYDGEQFAVMGNGGNIYAIANPLAAQVPNIALDGVYAYIKAK